jgi:hypothetical protein
MRLDPRFFGPALAVLGLAMLPGAPDRAHAQDDDAAIRRACLQVLAHGLRPLAEVRTQRFEGKVSAPVALCRGGEAALAARNTPWVDWSHYWATGDASSKSGKRDDTRLPIPPLLRHLVDRNKRGIDGALMAFK